MLKKLSKIVLKLFLLVVCLLTLLIIFLNWHAKREWLQYRQELEARGEILDFAKLIPPPGPDDQNFAMTPLFKEKKLSDRLQLKPGPGPDFKFKSEPSFGDWTQGRPMDLKAWEVYFGTNDIQAALAIFNSQLTEISEAVRRPFARFPIHYEDGLEARLPHVDVLHELGQLYRLRANVELVAGETDKASADIETIFLLADSLKNEPMSWSQKNVVNFFQSGIQILWEGIVGHKWSDAQLAAFQNQLIKCNLAAGWRRACQANRAMLTLAFDPGASDRTMQIQMGSVLLPGGEVLPTIFPCIFYWNLITLNRIEEMSYSTVPDDTERFNVKQLKSVELWRDKLWSQSFLSRLKAMLVTLDTGTSTGDPAKYVFAQSAVNEAQIACALERYRLVHNDYPEKLDALVPQYISKLPTDVITSGPLHYRRTDDGVYILYSVGWNEIDDGGMIGLIKLEGGRTRIDLRKSDWIWPTKFSASDNH